MGNFRYMIKPKKVCSCTPYFYFVRFGKDVIALEKALDWFFYENLKDRIESEEAANKVRDIIEETIEEVVSKDH